MKKRQPVHQKPLGAKQLPNKQNDSQHFKQQMDQAKLFKKTPADTITIK